MPERTLAGGKGDLIVVEDEAALAGRLADAFAAAASEAVAARNRFTVALAGGSTPQAAYELLAQEPRRSQLPWPGIEVFFGDERTVPPEDPESNYGMAKRALFDRVALPADRIHRMHGEERPERAAQAYAELLKERLGAEPVFDLIMLGMGPDGHTASLFPGNDPEAETEAIVRAPYVEKFKTFRITITPHVINHARHVMIATAGAAKADVLAVVLAGDYRPYDYPIQIVHPQSGKLTWLVDKAAAAKL